jgi:hypothetical protein
MFSFKIIIFFIFIFIIAIYLIKLVNSTIEGMENKSTCPDPIYVTDPDSNIVDNLLINDFMSYMDQKIQQVNSDLDVMTTLIAGTSFNIIIDPSNIADVSLNADLPSPKITMDSSKPPNYGIIFKLPKGRRGPIGNKGKDGQTGPVGPTGPVGKDGDSGKRIVLLQA